MEGLSGLTEDEKDYTKMNYKYNGLALNNGSVLTAGTLCTWIYATYRRPYDTLIMLYYIALTGHKEYNFMTLAGTNNIYCIYIQYVNTYATYTIYTIYCIAPYRINNW